MADTSPPRARRAPSRRARTAATATRTHASRTTGRRVAITEHAANGGVPGWIIALGVLVLVATTLALVAIVPARLASAPMLRLLVPVLCALAAGLAFVPMERRLDLPGLGWQGIVGWSLLGYVLAFVPAPGGALLDLPELPSYLLLFLAVFYAVSSAATPLLLVAARRIVRDDALHERRARRQAYELAVLVVAVLVLAAMRALSWWAMGLLVVALALTEALLMSQWEGTGNR